MRSGRQRLINPYEMVIDTTVEIISMGGRGVCNMAVSHDLAFLFTSLSLIPFTDRLTYPAELLSGSGKSPSVPALGKAASPGRRPLLKKHFSVELCLEVSQELVRALKHSPKRTAAE